MNSYSIDPLLWSYFDKDDSILIAASIVSYRDSTLFKCQYRKTNVSYSFEKVSKTLEKKLLELG